MKDYLKTKCCSLAEEAKIIRRLERSRIKKGRRAASLGKTEAANYHYSVLFGLRDHRTRDVRQESRHSNLAYGFIKGREYNEIEQSAFKQPNWKRVQTLVEKYGEGDKTILLENFATWKNKAIVSFEKKA